MRASSPAISRRSTTLRSFPRSTRTTSRRASTRVRLLATSTTLIGRALLRCRSSFRPAAARPGRLAARFRTPSPGKHRRSAPRARCGYKGARPGDVMQIPMTCSLANAPWQNYKACHDFLGILPLTTGSGIVTASRQQLEIAFRYGTNMWVSFPEYLTRLAEVCRDELKRDVRELKTKLLRTYLGPDVEGTLRRSLQDAMGLSRLRYLRHARDRHRRLRLPGARRHACHGRHALSGNRGRGDRRARCPRESRATWS